MEWGEAIRQVGILRSDPSSMTAAAMEGWAYPISQETLVLADLFDLTHLVNASPKGPKPKPHAIRPFKAAKSEKTFGDAGGRTPAEVREVLARARRGEIGAGMPSIVLV